MFIFGEALLSRDPANVTPDEFKPFEDAFNYMTARGKYHYRKTLEQYVYCISLCYLFIYKCT